MIGQREAIGNQQEARGMKRCALHLVHSVVPSALLPKISACNNLNGFRFHDGTQLVVVSLCGKTPPPGGIFLQLTTVKMWSFGMFHDRMQVGPMFKARDVHVFGSGSSVGMG